MLTDELRRAGIDLQRLVAMPQRANGAQAVTSAPMTPGQRKLAAIIRVRAQIQASMQANERRKR